MRFLPVFLDLQSGVVLLIGAGELVRAKLRLVASAGARVRWYATDDNHDLTGLAVEDTTRIELAKGDPIAADVSNVIAILCAGAGDIGVAMSARAKAVGLPVNVMDDLAHSTFIFPAIVDRGDVVVAVGPGDPALLRVKARRGLQAADIVFYDELVSPEVLDRARRDAARVPVGRRVGKPGIGQDAINKLLIEAAQSGQRAVRLKGGDPFIFGRGGEEIEVLRAAGVAYSVVPGITAGLGAAAQFEAPLTYRHEALRITFLTAHKAKDAETVDWSVLTDKKMTIVVYMGMTAAPSVRAGLLAAGRSPKTPVGIFARVTRPDAQAVVGTLENLPALGEKIDGGPAILIIGDVVAHSAPWRQSNLNQVISKLLDAAE